MLHKDVVPVKAVVASTFKVAAVFFRFWSRISWQHKRKKKTPTHTHTHHIIITLYTKFTYQYLNWITQDKLIKNPITHHLQIGRSKSHAKRSYMCLSFNGWMYSRRISSRNWSNRTEKWSWTPSESIINPFAGVQNSKRSRVNTLRRRRRRCRRRKRRRPRQIDR